MARMLEFQVERRYGDRTSYSGDIQYPIIVSKAKFIKRLRFHAARGDEVWYGSVNTIISRRSPRCYGFLIPGPRAYDRHFMALDVDGEEPMLAAARSLKLLDIKWYPIRSSDYEDEQHYWIVTDYIGSFSQVLDKMRQIAGVDHNYIDYCERTNRCSLRGVVWINRQGRYYRSNPVFTDKECKIDNPRIRLWIEEFKQWFEDTAVIRDEYIAAQRVNDEIEALRAALQTKGAVTSLASNPTFEI